MSGETLNFYIELSDMKRGLERRQVREKPEAESTLPFRLPRCIRRNGENNRPSRKNLQKTPRHGKIGPEPRRGRKSRCSVRVCGSGSVRLLKRSRRLLDGVMRSGWMCGDTVEGGVRGEVETDDEESDSDGMIVMSSRRNEWCELILQYSLGIVFGH